MPIDYTPARQFGKSKEEECLPIIQQFFDDTTICKTKGRFAAFDFESANRKIELKSRTNTYSKYPTTMIPMKKVVLADQNPDTEFYFFFNFTDGLYHIKYDNDTFQKFQRKVGGRFDRGQKELSEYIYIPIDHLTRIN